MKIVNKKAFKKLLETLEDAQQYAMDAIELDSDAELNTEIDVYGKLNDLLIELSERQE